MKNNWQETWQNNILEHLTATHTVSLLISVMAILGFSRSMPLPVLLKITVFNLAWMVLIFLSYSILRRCNFFFIGQNLLSELAYNLITLVLVMGVVIATGSDQSPIKVLFFIPVIASAVTVGRYLSITLAFVISFFLILTSYLRAPFSSPNYGLEAELIFSGVLLLVGWLISGITDIEKNTRDGLSLLNNQLEDMVAERTRELEATNRELEQEIQERRQAEAALLESQARFRSIYDNASIGLALVDEEEKIVTINGAFCSFLGVTKEECIGKKLTDFIYREDLHSDSQQAEQLLHGMIRSYTREKRFVHANGSLIWGRLSISLIREGNTWGKVVLCEDMTALKSQEHQLQALGRIYDALHRVLEDASVTDASLSGIYSLADLTSSLQTEGYENEVAARLVQAACDLAGAEYGYYFGCINNRLEPVFSAGLTEQLLPQYLERGLEGVWQKLLDRGQTGPIYLPDLEKDPVWSGVNSGSGIRSCFLVPLHYGERLFGMYLLISSRKNGFLKEKRVVVETLASYISSAMENARLFSDVQKAYEHLYSTRQQLLHSQKMEAVGQLAGGLAHDLNNQLTVIHACVDLYLPKYRNDAQIQKALLKIRKAAQRSADLARELMLFARKHPQFLEPVLLNDMIADLMEIIERMIGENITIEIDLAERLWMIEADSGNIEQVIINLILNARDAMPDGGTITLKTGNRCLDEGSGEIPGLPGGRYVCLTVMDTGTGMDERVKNHLFEPFFTTKEPGKGTGLGLSVVYGIIKAHRGWINVESRLGRGSRFDIYLPALPENWDRREEEEMVDWTLSGDGLGILLVEDDYEVMMVIKRILEEKGFRVFPCGNYSQALQEFEERNSQISLVVSDVMLPDGNGLELVRHLRRCNPSLGLLLISGYAGEGSEHGGLTREHISYLPKPFDARKLLNKVREVLEREKDQPR